MTAVLALLVVLIPASVTLIGYWFKQQSDKRLNQEHKQAEWRLEGERIDKRHQAQIDLALRAIDLFRWSGEAPASPAKSAAGLLALAHLDFVDLAVALLVDLWRPYSTGVSTETAIQV